MPTTNDGERTSAFTWNPGGWFGAQIGATLWLLILGLVLLPRDLLTGAACLTAFLVLNAFGLHLWRGRKRLSAYQGLQRFLFLASVVVAGVVVLVNTRGLSEPPAPGALVSTHLPYWVAGLAPLLMLWFYLRERQPRSELGRIRKKIRLVP